ncbi:MAG: GGDEF domain-containing protein [Clostridium sp.]|nr:GGDEF domain-containing protein [Acetatifactor muris]MCM1528012.1 GGDEF domain-containing protein [Bacteroides sp.]MCM1563099.1 GGDEF domain-containing protein [Clostridium sp.]
MLALAKASVACFLFTIYMVSFYYRKPHIPVKSTKIFQCLIVVALLNSSFDLITLYTVNHRDVVPEFVNLAVHVVYLMSILGFVFLLFLYMRSYLETNLKFSKPTRFLHSLPLVLSAVGILVLPITYVQGKTTAYSLGAKAYALYGSLVVYLVLILYYCLRYWKILDGEKRVAIILAVPLFVVTALVQMMIPETLLVVVCSTLILLGLILSNENVEKYLDEKTALFNQYAFETVLDDYDFEKQKIVAAVLCFCKTENSMDWNRDVLILNDIYKELKQYRLYGYRIGENGVVFIGSAKERLAAALEKIKQKTEDKYGSENISIETKLLTGNAVDTKYSCMRNIISFCTESGSRLAYIDYLTNIYNRNALERDLAKQQDRKSVSYLLADLNNLKIVNDTIGHSAGDKLLQDFAVMLADAAGEEGRAYRQGGDEFAVLYGKDAGTFIRDLEKRCEDYNKACAVPISYAIGYSLLENDNFRDDADKMMYADKRRKKGIGS